MPSRQLFRASLVMTTLLTAAGCGGSDKPAVKAARAPVEISAWDLESPPEAASPEVKEQREDKVAIPSECADPAAKICTPPTEFVDELCESSRPNVAFTMFRKDAPWQRAYVRVNKLEAWYAGGSRSRPAELQFREELIVLKDRSASAGGMVVSGAGSYDVLRWDGTCVSVMNDEISMSNYGMPDVAVIEWRRLDPDIQTALEQDQKIVHKNEFRREKCKASGGSDKSCARAKKNLSRMIASYVRRGGDVPVRRHLR
jgi:hypothetical protein